MRRLDYIAHHGILGQKWGIRRFQDKNGRYTAEGRKRYLAEKTKSLNNKKQKADIESKYGEEWDKLAKEADRKYVLKNIESIESDRFKFQDEFASTKEGKAAIQKISKIGKKIDATNDDEKQWKLSYEMDDALKEFDIAQGKYVYNKMASKYDKSIADIETEAYGEVQRYVADKLESRYDGTLSKEELRDPYWRDELAQDVDIYAPARRRLK